MQEAETKRVLVCPLDWGLGHATRCIPIIRELLDAGAQVILASDGPQLKLLREEFPGLEWSEFPGYKVTYSKKSGAAWHTLFYAPVLLYRIFREHESLKKLIRETKAEAVISDNRYGLWNKQVRTVFITHQLNVIAPGLLRFSNPLLRKLTRIFIRLYDECWIPDSEGEDNLSGILSHGFPVPPNVRYIGLLSRFDKPQTTLKDPHYDLLALVSGPEPQRSLFEDSLLARLPAGDRKCLLVKGIPGNSEITHLRKNLDTVNHLSAGRLQAILAQKPIVISRSGYSTLMDIRFTGNKAILIPTPGQTEQEYLAGRLAGKNGFYICKQDENGLVKAVEELDSADPPLNHLPATGYREAVSHLLSGTGNQQAG